MDRRPYSVSYHAGYDSRIKNLAQLAAGTGAKYLRCLIGEGRDLVAVSWHRKEPEPQHGYMTFRF